MNAAKPGENNEWLTRQWIAAGLVSASVRFVLAPFVDNFVRDRCHKFAVSRTLVAHESEESLDRLNPYYFSSGGHLGGCSSMTIKAPMRLLLFPFRKSVLVMTSVRGAALEVMRTVLLGRTLDRYVRAGTLSGRPAEAARMTTALDDAFARMDLRVVKSSMADALSSVDNWKVAATETAKLIADRRQAMSERLATSTDIENGATKAQKAFDRPETLRLFAEFDRRFDDRMQKKVVKTS